MNKLESNTKETKTRNNFEMSLTIYEIEHFFVIKYSEGNRYDLPKKIHKSNQTIFPNNFNLLGSPSIM